MISQEDGVRLMAAAEKWANAEMEYITAFHRNSSGQIERAATAAIEAKKAFAELVSKLTQPEGL